jgi:hypothetical protein
VADVRSLFDVELSGWRSRAACRDEPDPLLFLPDKNLSRHQPGSPTILLAMLTCSGCLVRRDCLREALEPVEFDAEMYRTNVTTDRNHADTAFRPTPQRITMTGVWGGTTDEDRLALRDMPICEALERLEASFPRRLAAVARAFKRSRTWRRAKRGRPARAKALLANPQVATLLAVTRGRCLACSSRLPALARSDARYCGVRCRVAAHRAPAGRPGGVVGRRKLAIR